MAWVVAAAAVATTVAGLPAAQAGGGVPAPRPGVDLGPFVDLEALLRDQHQGFLGRQPTSAELAAARRQIAGGASTASVIAQLWARQYPEGQMGDLTRAFTAIGLPDPSGYAFWVRARRTQSLVRVVDRVLHTRRYEWFIRLDAPSFVDAAYRLVLRRSPDPGGAGHWRAKLGRGASRAELVASLSQSAEHRRLRLQEYGNAPVEEVVGGIVLHAGLTGRIPPAGSAGAGPVLASIAEGRVEQLVASTMGSPAFGRRPVSSPLAFAPTTILPLAGPGDQAQDRLAVGDLDGDGRRDLAVVDGARQGGPAQLRILHQGPNRSFAGTTLDTGVGDIVGVAVGDVSGDGRADLLVSGPASLEVHRQGPTGGLLPPETLATRPLPERSGPPVVADLDLDGLDDVFLADADGGQVFRQTPQHALVPGPTIEGEAGGLAGCRIAGLDAEPRPDLVCRGAGGVQVRLQGADGAFAAPQTYALPNPWDDVDDLELGDVTGDGRPDLVTIDSAHPWNRFAVRPGRADGTFGEATLHWTPERALQLALADLDGDGRLDAAVGTNGPQAWTVFRSFDRGRFGPAQLVGSTDHLDSSVADDVDGDGRADLVTATWTVGQVQIEWSTA